MQSFIVQVFGTNGKQFVMCLFGKQAISFPSYQAASLQSNAEQKRKFIIVFTLYLSFLIDTRERLLGLAIYKDCGRARMLLLSLSPSTVYALLRWTV